MYKKVWVGLASKLSISMPQTFRLGDFLESLILRQYRAVELLQNICTNVDADRTWTGKGLRTTNFRVEDLETQGLENFPEWRGNRMALEQVGWAEAEVRDIQVALGDANFTHKKYEDELKLIFDKVYVFQEEFLQNNLTVTERVDNMEASNLTGLIPNGLVRWRRWWKRYRN